MSGRKRALLRMNERDRKKLQKIEARLSEVNQDFSIIRAKINEAKGQLSHDAEIKHQNRDFELAESFSQADWRIKEMEVATQEALDRHFDDIDSAFYQSNEIIDNRLRNSIIDHTSLVMDFIKQFEQDLANKISNVEENFSQYQAQNQYQQVIAWQTINYARDILLILVNQNQSEPKWIETLNGIKQTLFVAWTNFESGSFQAAMVHAQQAIANLIELRFLIESHNFELEQSRLAAVEKTLQVLELARNCRIVNALDLEGNELDIQIDVDYWTGGSISKAIATLDNIQSELMNSRFDKDLIILNELIMQTLPDWERAIREYVSLARIEIIASQTRYEIAKTVVSALAEQGFELESGSYSTNDMRSPYSVVLGNLEGSKVQVNISTSEQSPLDYILDINSYDAEIRTEHELRQRARELLGSVEFAGLQVGQLYQAEPENSKTVRENVNNHYSTKDNIRKKF